MVVPKIIAVEFRDDQGTGLVIARGPGKADPPRISNLPPQDSRQSELAPPISEDSGNDNKRTSHRESSVELSLGSITSNPMKTSADEI